MLKKVLLILFTIFVTKIFCLAYDVHLPAGSMIKVYTKVPITTQNLSVGSPLYFIVPSDVWVLEKKAIEKGDIFLGEVSMLHVPIQGVNAAMSVDIKTLVKKTTKEKKQIKAKLIFSNGSEILGGNLTSPMSYNTTVHPRKVYGNIWGGALQYVPSGEYEFGKHMTINSRDILFIKLDENYYI